MKRVMFFVFFLLIFATTNIIAVETTLIRDEKITKDLVNEYLDVDLFSLPYSSAYSFKEKPSGGMWMIGFATDATWSRIIYGDGNDNWIKSFGEYGSGDGQFKSPRGIASDALGNVFVADYGNDRIVKLRYDFEDEELYFVMNMTSDELSEPIDLDIDYNYSSTNPTDDSIFVINYGNSKIVKFSTDGDFCGSFGEFGAGDGQFRYPMGIAKGVKWCPFPSLDDLYVVDTGNRRIVFIQVKWLPGQIDTSYFYYDLPQTSYPISARTDYFFSLWVTDKNQCQLLKFNVRFDFLTTFGSKGTGWNQFLYPNAFTFAKGYGNSFLAERWTSNSGGQAFIPGTDIIDLSATPNTDYTLVYVDYMLTEHSRVTYYVYDKYEQLVREVGPYNFYPRHLSWIWDCLDDDSIRVCPGIYEIRIVAKASYSNNYTMTASTYVDLSFVIIDFYCEPQEIDVSEEETYITFDLNYDAGVTIEVYQNSDLVRTVIQDSFFEHGENSVIWDGKDDNGWLVLPGEYQIHIYAEEVMFGHDVEQDIPVTVKGTVVEGNYGWCIPSETWDKEGSPYVIYGGQETKMVPGDSILTIDPGVRVMFWPHDEKYDILVAGTIEARGEEEDSILISSYRKSWDREKGDWKAIRTTGGGQEKTIFKYCNIEYGGDELHGRPANIMIESYGADTVSHCRITNSAANGMHSENESCVIDSNEFAQNDSFPLVIYPPNGVGKVYDNLFLDNGIQAIKVKAGGVVTDNAVWTNQGVPYLMSGSYFDIYSNTEDPCTLTIAPGVTLQFKKGIRQIGYNNKGVLIAEGTEDEKITFAGVSDTSHWDEGINVYIYGSIVLKNCLIKNAASGNGGSIYLRSTTHSNATIDSCEIRGSRGHGIRAQPGSDIQISNCTISDCDSFPIVVGVSAIENITNNTFKNNGIQEMCIRGGSSITENVFWQNPGIPYRIENSISVYKSEPEICTLTIEKGNVLRFRQSAGLLIGASGNGMLIAQGTKEEPIIFTALDSLERWYGIYFHQNASDSSILRNCEISFGGRIGYQNIYCYNSSPRIDSCFIRSPGQTGIYLTQQSSPKITNTTICENTIGIDCSYGSPQIQNCNIFGNIDYGIYCGSSTKPQIKNCNIYENREYGIYSSSIYSIKIDSCNIFENSGYGVYNANSNDTIDADTTCWWGSETGPYDPSHGPPDYNPFGLGDMVSDYVYYRPWLDSALELLIFSGHISENTTWSSDILINGDVWVDAGATLTIDAGVNVKFFPNFDKEHGGIDVTRAEFIIHGGLTLLGNESKPIIFTSNASEPEIGDWYGIRFVEPEKREYQVKELEPTPSQPKISKKNLTTDNARTPEFQSTRIKEQEECVEKIENKLQKPHSLKPVTYKRADIDLEPNEKELSKKTFKETEREWQRRDEKKDTRRRRNIRYLEIEYAKTGLTLCKDEILTMEHSVCRKNETGLKLTGNSDVTVKDCIFEDNIVSGLWIGEGISGTIMDGSIRSNGMGIVIQGDDFEEYGFISKESQEYPLDIPKFSGIGLSEKCSEEVVLCPELVLQGLFISENNTGILCASECKLQIKENKIIDNRDYGVYITDDAAPDLGGMGHNYIYGSGLYDLYNNTDNTIMAKRNYWGTMNIDTVEVHIYDYYYDNSLCIVEIEPLWEGEGERGTGGAMSSGEGITPLIYSLKTASPNPFVNNTTIAYSIAKPGNVSLYIYDISGRLVKTLIDENKDAGVYKEKWDGIDNRNRKVATGVYFTRLTSRNFTSVRKVILVR
ncbi:right-handed parallel beta-helix repeat-containing protein [candidate division WOR-3 bacterium]|nr:right-handed parallel beta-helix repeat-containing protein [candidate division WOR-3 bacterium]